MTSVVSEAFATSYRLAKPERLSQASGQNADGGFAALVDNEIRSESRPAGTRPERSRADDAKEASEAVDAAGDDAPALTDQSEPVDGTAEDTADDSDAVPATDAGILDSLVTPTVATCGRDSGETVAAQAVPAALPEQAAPEAAAPVPSDSIESIPVPAVAAATPARAEQSPVGSDLSEITPAQANALAAAKAAAAPGGQKSEEAIAQTEETTAAGAPVDTDAPEQPKRLPPQAAPARTDSDPARPDGRPDVAVTPENTARSTQPAHDAAMPLATPSPVHAATQTATPQAVPASAGQPVPVDSLAVEIAAQARAGHSRFEIRLDPPELGRIDVRLDIDHDGNVKSRLVIERADTYDLLRRDQSTLERALQQAGLKTSDQALEFSLRDQGAQHRHTDELPRGTQAAILETEVSPSEAANGYARLLGARGGIDIRV